MSAELKPCPFCWSTNVLMFEPSCRPETPYNPADRLFPAVRCMDCYAEAVGKNEDYKGTSAIAAWNTRASDAALASQAAEIERLREALKPFANYMDDGMDCNYIGEPLPDADGVGWVYLTQGDFRRARAALDGEKP